MIVVSDTTPLRYLAVVGGLDWTKGKRQLSLWPTRWEPICC